MALILTIVKDDLSHEVAGCPFDLPFNNESFFIDFFYRDRIPRRHLVSPVFFVHLRNSTATAIEAVIQATLLKMKRTPITSAEAVDPPNENNGV